MICLPCINRKVVLLCKFCDKCGHLCLSQCTGSKRSEALNRPPIVIEVPKFESTISRFCESCGNPFSRKHGLQIFCKPSCGKNKRNKKYINKRIVKESELVEEKA